ncbi:MAG: HAMP domain-containing sensor histidine kinase [Candidatus Hinthialibacter antarcticus]|nr:HAMP domain-containing sensor histidine kinase [Candidatus Hinthialibacter antarcticus]
MSLTYSGAVSSIHSQRRIFWLIVAALALVLSIGLPIAGFYLVDKFRMILFQQVRVDNAALSHMFENTVRQLKTHISDRDEWLRAVQTNVENSWDQERGYVCMIDSDHILQAAPDLEAPRKIDLEEVFIIPIHNDGTSFLQERTISIAELLDSNTIHTAAGRIETWNGQMADMRMIKIDGERWLIGVHQYEQAVQTRLKELIPFIVVIGVILFASIVFPFGFFTAWLIHNHETEREQHVQHIEQHSIELQAMQDQKNRLYARISHDLRAPLNSVVGASELVAEGTYGAVNEKQKKAMAIIDRNVSSLLKMIDGILELARLESGLFKLDVKPLQITELLSDLTENLRPLAERKSLELICSTNGAFPAINTDKEKLYLILQNLISNAIQFTETGSIKVSVELKSNDEFTLSVQDTGLGISPEDQKNIFQEFSRSAAASSHSRGFGLGLAITKELAQALNGRLELDSQLGEGATFRLVLPREFTK